MKTLIIIILIFFLLKKNKPHITLIRGGARLLALAGKGFHKLWDNVVVFWASVYLEMECAGKSEDEQKNLRECYTHWVDMYVDFSSWKKEHADNKNAIMQDVGDCSWATHGLAFEPSDSVSLLSIITSIIGACFALLLVIAWTVP